MRRRWLVAGVFLGVGVPIVAGVGFAAALAVAFAMSRFLPGWPWAVPWAWGLIGVCIALWFLVSRCVRVGGWRTLGTGVVGMSAIALASYVLGLVEQSLQPANPMAGAGSAILANVFGLCSVLAFVMGVAAIRFCGARSVARPQDGRGTNSRSESSPACLGSWIGNQPVRRRWTATPLEARDGETRDQRLRHP